MTIRDLTREQLVEVKQHYYCDRHDNVSLGELAIIDDLVSDDEIFDEYECVVFVPDDFSEECE